MIASLTFTYGTEREDIFKYKSKDKSDLVFRNSLDLNLYVFHNSSRDYIKSIKEKSYLNGFNFTFAEIEGPYPGALRSALQFLKAKNVEKIVFLQDDVFCVAKDTKVVRELSDTLKSTIHPYLNFEITCEDTNRFKPILETPDFKYYNTDTAFYKEKGWSFDDSPYYSTLDFAMNVIYDDTYFSYPDIWSAEHYLKYKFDNINIPRYVPDVQFFRRVNFLGKNTHNRDNELKFLNEHFV